LWGGAAIEPTPFGEIVAGVATVCYAAYLAYKASKKECSCVCYQKGIGPNPIGKKKSESSCKKSCMAVGYSGYKCGGDVKWTN